MPQHPRACTTETDNAGSKNANADDNDDEGDNKRLLRIKHVPASHTFSPSILTPN